MVAFSRGGVGFEKERSPDGTDTATVVNHLGDFEGVFEFLKSTSRNGLFDEQGDPRELLQKLGFDISAWKGAASEHWRTSNDDSPGVFALGHRAHEFVQILADPGFFVGGFDETFALLLEDNGSTLGRRIY